jgi:hypothetical protein
MSKQNWYFTFMWKQRGLRDKYVKIHGTFLDAREEMCIRHGVEWAFQYSEEEFLPQIEEYKLEELR